MNKQQLRQDIVDTLKAELSSAMDAAQQAHDAATHEQSKAETQYDTLGLENAYLAQGLSRRIDELIQAISQLENWTIKDFTQDDDIYLGALLTLQAPSKPETLTVFMAISGGGVVLKQGTSTIKVITPQTPLGQALLGLGVEDTVRVSEAITYKILELQ